MRFAHEWVSKWARLFRVLTYQSDLCTFAYTLSCALSHHTCSLSLTALTCSHHIVDEAKTTQRYLTTSCAWPVVQWLCHTLLSVFHSLSHSLLCCATWSNLSIQVLNVQPLPLPCGFLSCALVYAFPMHRSGFVISNVNHWRICCVILVAKHESLFCVNLFCKPSKPMVFTQIVMWLRLWL